MNEEEILHQACAVPYRRRKELIEFCLITSTRTNEWSFPKGTIKGDYTAEDIALNRAMKEVGLHGTIIEELGYYTYRKWEMTLEVVALLMEVERCDDDWQDSSQRERRWVDLNEALSMVRRNELKTLLETAHSRILKTKENS